MIDSLGDRMKLYENHEVGRRFIPMLPVYARIDGRNFSSFTRDMERPFDERMSEAMIKTTEALVHETHANIGYTQSDEISLVWLADKYESSIYFDYRITKLTSVLASYATAVFMTMWPREMARLPHFDCRAFQLPNKTEAANCFLWRERDATKNAISMAARSYYSHNDLFRKNGSQMQEMLFAKGINFNEYPAFFKRGTFVRREVVSRPLSDEELMRIPEKNRPGKDEEVMRSVLRRLDMPSFTKVINREAVIFDGAEPHTEDER